jgi:TIR domain
MADVFISYAREDQPFVRKLQDALEKHNRNTWIDWKSIRPTAEWKQEVYSAIDNADSFAAVISPDFIVSKPCQDERDAEQVLPLLRGEFDDVLLLLLDGCPPDSAQTASRIRQHDYLSK